MILTFIAQTIFLTSAAALFYAYVGYPLLVFAVSRLFPKPIRRAAYAPTVTVLIAA